MKAAHTILNYNSNPIYKGTRVEKAIKNITYYLLLGMITISCSTSDDILGQLDDTTQPQATQVDLLVNVVSRAQNTPQALTRSHRAPTFSTMDLLVAIPFHTNGANVTASDNPLIDLVGADETNNRVVSHNTYYVERCHLMTGTDRMLVYGKATKPSPTNPAVDGELSALPDIRKNTADIQFSLTSIRESTEAPAEANALASYMTAIANTTANTTSWSTTTDPTLKSYYLDFIRMGSEGAGLMSGAAANIKAFVAALRALLTGSDALSTAIKTNIDANSTIASNTYPRSLGLPDGAAAIRWTGSQFEVKTTTTQLDNINGINRYTYPAELMFFVDSPIRTSAEEVSKATYQNTDKLWSAFLNDYYKGSTAVNTNTKAVAVENPIQYGVAKLNLTLTGMSPTLSDAKNEVVLDADMAHLPLTGVIIGGQHTVGFNMKPQGAQTDVDGRFIYETTVDATNLATEGYKTSTLVLQSYDNEKVPVILEFENKTGHAFTGKDGTVYPETRFYLIGMIDPADKKEEGKDYTNRVFTQDYTTTMSMSVTSLAKAYTCMPDLLAPRLEVGVQVVTKWIQATTTNVELR